MRILYVVHQFFPKWYTGTERFVLDLARQMRKMGHYVEVLTYGFDDNTGFSVRDGIMHKRYEFQNIPVTSVRHVTVPEDLSFNIWDNKLENILNTIITKENFDVVHVLHPMRLGYAIKVAHSAGLPTILTLTDFWVICPVVQLLTPEGKLCYGSSDSQKCVKECYGKLWADKLTRRFKEIEELVRMVDYIVAPTHFLASLVKNVLDLHISIIPYGIDYRYIKERPEKSGEQLTLGFIGTLMPHKGVHTLIEAIKLVDDNTVRVKIYGDPSHHPNYYSQLTSIADNDKRIEFTGKYDYSEISRILSELDVVVVPSIWWENAPFTIQTSFAYKTPVIASNLGGMSEVVTDGVNGFLFDAGNAEDLADVIRKITTNHEVLNSIRENIISPPRIEEAAFEYEKRYLNIITGKSQELIVDTNGRIRDACKAKYGNDFIFDIDKKDEMYLFLLNHPDIKDPTAEYFRSGDLMLTNIQEIFEDLGYSFDQINSFLDFAGGYGRFTRFLIQKLSHEKITISDIDKAAVDFGKKTFGVNGFYSVDNPKRLIHDNRYDVIYVASLFSHLASRLWGEWLKRLYDTLNEGGILIFSTHGEYCYNLLDEEIRTHVKKVEQDFFYMPMSETTRLSTKDYGTTYVTYDYVKKVIRQNNLQKLIGFYPKKLCAFQDIYVIQKEITKTRPVELVEEVK